MILSILLCLDILILLSTGTHLAVVSSTSQYTQHIQNMATYIILGFFTPSLLCNSLAITGLSIGERVLLVPWLMLYLVLQMMMVMGLVSSVIHQPASMGQALLVMVQLLLVVIWRQVQSQYQVMGLLNSTQAVA